MRQTANDDLVDFEESVVEMWLIGVNIGRDFERQAVRNRKER